MSTKEFFDKRNYCFPLLLLADSQHARFEAHFFQQRILGFADLRQVPNDFLVLRIVFAQVSDRQYAPLLDQWISGVSSRALENADHDFHLASQFLVSFISM